MHSNRRRAPAAVLFRKETFNMDTYGEIMRALGRIEGELREIRKLSERVRRLEHWQFWLKGGWAFLVAALGYVCRNAYSK